MNIYGKLQKIQGEMKAPKNLYNSFGKYKYRNAEGICEAFKPYGEKYKVALFLTDTVEEIGGRVYIRATATLIDTETTEPPMLVTVSALAREAPEKKGMDDAQVTGATSSYARKYALNGLFLLDDTKDPDTEEYQGGGREERKEVKQTPEQRAEAAYPSRDEMIAVCEGYFKGEKLQKLLDYYKISALKYLKKEPLMACYNMAMRANGT
jgi:hypothetical protein